MENGATFLNTNARGFIGRKSYTSSRRSIDSDMNKLERKRGWLNSDD
jgi:hypothetical protein